MEFRAIPLLPVGAVLVDTGRALYLPQGIAFSVGDTERWTHAGRTFIVVQQPGAAFLTVGARHALSAGVHELCEKERIPA